MLTVKTILNTQRSARKVSASCISRNHIILHLLLIGCNDIVEDLHVSIRYKYLGETRSMIQVCGVSFIYAEYYYEHDICGRASDSSC